MSTETVELKLLQTVKKKEDLLGQWRLVYKLTNRMGPGGFTGRMIDSYSDPLTGKPRHLYNENGMQQPGYLIQNQTTILEPRTNRQHAHIVDFLLGHPSVFTEQAHANLDARYIAAKQSNPRIVLTNLDYQDVEEVLDEEYIDKLVGRIVLDGGPQSIGVQKLRFVLAKLNLKYRDDKYLFNMDAEKPKLRKRLKDYVRKSKTNAEEVNLILENIVDAQYRFEIKEMKRLGVLLELSGAFKYKDVPLGATVDGVILYFTNNTELYSEMSGELYKRLKAEAK